MSYIKIEDTRIAYFDIDQTLISYFPPEVAEDLPAPQPMTYSHNRVTVPVWPMLANIALITELRACGFQIACWSQSGSSHSERIVKLLGLENLVDLILPKPEIYVDDKPFESQGISRVFKS